MAHPSVVDDTRVRAHPWMPMSPCGPPCLEEDVDRVGRCRRWLRLVAGTVSVLLACLSGPVLVVTRGRVRDGIARVVVRQVLRGFGVRLVVTGRGDLAESRGRGALVVHNHVSWLDALAVNAVRPMRSLAKVQIASWPVVGRIVRRAGTVFVDRERLSRLPDTVAELASALRDGSLVAVSGEGTTWCGRQSGPFVPAPFQAAIDAGVPVRPLALRFRVTGHSGRPTASGAGVATTQPAFVGTETLLSSMARVAAVRGLVVEAVVCPEIAPGAAPDRRALAARAEHAVLSALHRSQVSLGTDDLSRSRSDDADGARSHLGDDDGAVVAGQRVVPALVRAAGPQGGRGGQGGSG